MVYRLIQCICCEWLMQAPTARGPHRSSLVAPLFHSCIILYRLASSAALFNILYLNNLKRFWFIIFKTDRLIFRKVMEFKCNENVIPNCIGFNQLWKKTWSYQYNHRYRMLSPFVYYILSFIYSEYIFFEKQNFSHSVSNSD